MVRVYDPQPELADYASAGLRFWRDFGADHPELYTPIGLAYFLAPENVEQARRFVERQDNADHGMRLVPAAEIADRCPALHPDYTRDGRMAIWEPQAGHINPRIAARALTDRAQSLGASAIEGVRVRRIRQQSDHLRVETGFGGIRARRVIVATGAAPHLLDQPEAVRTRSIVLSSFSSKSADHPNLCLIDEAQGCYLRPGQTGHFYVGGAKPAESATPEDLAVDPDQAMRQNTGFRKTLLGSDAYDPISVHVGHDGYTEDFLPILRTPSDSAAGAFCGFSGRGAKYIPALAQQMVSGWMERGAL
jgi:glycine/D-amino acid oxidase-like deaminating enzyme